MGTNTHHSDETESGWHDSSRERLYEIVSDEATTLEEKRRRIVELGTEYLGTNLGFVSAIELDEQRFSVLVSTDDGMLAEGAEYHLDRTYCRRCVRSGSDLAVSDAAAEGWEGDPAYEEHGLGCYLGTPLRVDGELVGTLCFADEGVRDPEFSPVERSFVELAARLLGRAMENHRHQKRLQRRERELDRRERQLVHSRGKYESLIRAAPDAILLIESESRRIVEANESAADLTGYSCEELAGMSLLSLCPPERGAEYADGLSAAAEGDGEPTTELPDGSQMVFHTAAGEEVPIEVSAEVVEFDGRSHVQAIVRDVSERLDRQRELRVKNRAIEDAPVGVSIADADGDKELVYVNDKFEDTTGYASEAALGRNCRFLQGDRTSQSGTDAIRRALRSERPIQQELLNYRADGSAFWNAISIAPVEDRTGETTHYVGFQRDVTDRKRREQMIEVLNRVLRHNLRNEMNVATMEANRLRERLDGDLMEAADRIYRAAESLTAIGERARDIQRVVHRREEPGPGDLVETVEEVAAELRGEFPDAAVSVTAPERQSALVSGAVREALHELGANAVEHGDGAVDFTVEDDSPVVRIEDAGPGLPEVEQTALDRGEVTQLAHGSGLGLWFVNWVVTDAGGRVEVSVEDGTTVTVHLPRPED